MNCEQGLSLINARIDSELLPEDRHRLTVHLGECSSCQLAVDEVERADHELARIFGTRRRAASAVADRVLEAWFDEAPLPSRWRIHLRWVSAVAAGLAMALFLYGPHTWNGSSRGNQDERVSALVEEWKQSDAPQEVELRLRSMGTACATPLAEAVQTWEGDANDERRLRVARVLCDLADTSQIPTLIALLGDTSSEIRTLSEASLVRLTGRQRVNLVVPKVQQAASCSNPQGEWREWWNKNKDQFERSGG
ncbi:MAG: hypothetical protein DHS20C16_02840 [Phycisphaerae bacterium]|nr:MAG: hypothetical protein DHS20C16_02840 [Phycisphaerae bacterium]